MKYAEEYFPMGTYKRQKNPGAFCNDFLAMNLDIIAETIVNDMTFLGLISGSDGVGNGKSSVATTVGAYLTYKINKLHKVNNSFTADNMVFSAEALEKASFELPLYSVIILDESDDLKEHSMKEFSMRIKSYFRKCRQLNQILIIITPSFFELNKFYALNRSHFLINTKFVGKYVRGTFDFYGTSAKKKLYLKGRKEWNYDASSPDFTGGFAGSYFFFPDMQKEIKRYKQKKYDDMIRYNRELKERLSPAQLDKKIRKEIFNTILKNLPDMTIKDLSVGFGISERTGNRWKMKEEENDEGQKTNINNNTMNNDDLIDCKERVEQRAESSIAQ